jgi:hypothetical protein
MLFFANNPECDSQPDARTASISGMFHHGALRGEFLFSAQSSGIEYVYELQRLSGDQFQFSALWYALLDGIGSPIIPMDKLQAPRAVGLPLPYQGDTGDNTDDLVNCIVQLSAMTCDQSTYSRTQGFAGLADMCDRPSAIDHIIGEQILDALDRSIVLSNTGKCTDECYAAVFLLHVFVRLYRANKIPADRIDDLVKTVNTVVPRLIGVGNTVQNIRSQRYCDAMLADRGI